MVKVTDGSWSREAVEWQVNSYYTDTEGDIMCAQCFDTVSDPDGAEQADSGWRCFVRWANWEDEHLFCDECGYQIESRYTKG